MRQAQLVVHGGTIATDYGVFPGTVVAEGGRVQAIMAPDAALPEAEVSVDASGLVLLPGVIDPHVHYQEPGPATYREDFTSGTMASAAGGVTTVLEHPLSVPPPKDRETFLAKRRLAEERAVIDFGLWGALVPDSISHVAELHELGAVAFKAFMSRASGDYPMLDDGLLYEAMAAASAVGAIVGVHAESDLLTEHFTAKMRAAGREDARAIAEGRPPVAECEAIQRALLLAHATGARVHIVHMSVPEGAELISEWRRRGVDATSETCPHYLHLDWTALDRLGPYAKCKPPLRSPESREKLWKVVLDGGIDFCGSDHAPYSREEKEGSSIWDAGWGLIGTETMLSVLLNDGVRARGWDLSAVARFTSTNVARVFGLFPQKGTIRVGSDADCVLVDLQGERRVRAEALLSKQKWSPLDGEALVGTVAKTIVRGRIVYDGEAIVVPPGSGRFVAPGHRR